MTQLTIPGEPKGKARPVVVKGHAFTPKNTVLYENLIKTEYERQCEGEFYEKGVPIGLNVCAFFSIPKSVSMVKRAEMLCGGVRPTKKPDADNLLKTIADGLNGIAFYDDAQIVMAHVEKFYSERPRVEVTIRSFE